MRAITRLDLVRAVSLPAIKKLEKTKAKDPQYMLRENTHFLASMALS